MINTINNYKKIKYSDQIEKMGNEKIKNNKANKNNIDKTNRKT